MLRLRSIGLCLNFKMAFSSASAVALSESAPVGKDVIEKLVRKKAFIELPPSPVAGDIAGDNSREHSVDGAQSLPVGTKRSSPW